MGPVAIGVILFVTGFLISSLIDGLGTRGLAKENMALRRTVDALLHEVRVLQAKEVRRTMDRLRRQIGMN